MRHSSSEYAIVGAAVGAAMTGRRPVAEILFSDFLTTCMDPIVNQAAKLRYMSGGQYALPLVVRTPGGGGIGMKYYSDKEPGENFFYYDVKADRWVKPNPKGKFPLFWDIGTAFTAYDAVGDRLVITLAACPY